MWGASQLGKILTDINAHGRRFPHVLFIRCEEIGCGPESKEKSRLRRRNVFYNIVCSFTGQKRLAIFGISGKTLDEMWCFENVRDVVCFQPELRRLLCLMLDQISLHPIMVWHIKTYRGRPADAKFVTLSLLQALKKVPRLHAF